MKTSMKNIQTLILFHFLHILVWFEREEKSLWTEKRLLGFSEPKPHPAKQQPTCRDSTCHFFAQSKISLYFMWVYCGIWSSVDWWEQINYAAFLFAMGEHRGGMGNSPPMECSRYWWVTISNILNCKANDEGSFITASWAVVSSNSATSVSHPLVA